MAAHKGVIFDLDGTLIDSAPDLLAALNRVLASRKLAPLPAAAVRGMIGDGAKALVERAWAARGQSAGPAELADFLAEYEANATVETVAYPGIPAALAVLAGQGYRLAICTNKPTAAAAIVLRGLGLRDCFQAVIGGDSTAHRKPDPRHLQAAVAALGIASAVMVGDHENDMAAASGLNLPSIFVAWGYGRAEGTRMARAPAELPGLVAGLLGAGD